MIYIEYNLGDAGWATATIGNGHLMQQIRTSYLHDTLKQLGESALCIKEDKGKRVIFMDEPGEHHLVISKFSEKEIAYELRWYNDHTDWNAIEDDTFTLILSGKTTTVNYVNEVRNILKTLWKTYGAKSYKEKWINHEFPIDIFEQLK
ncbi:hypothetical protein [uncultured Psychroserpens sp.]|uniref:hypothetical protein n=1 Tax=uncultured Psychroserpens sp. TaxID=255436 RepID=UPI00260D3FFF|nr:hypothetical protein [uncultured Psychroserpens sp.]